MVGLNVILENYRDLSEKRSPQIIRNCSIIKTPSDFVSVSGFLEYCFLCNKKLSPGKDIYMYKGDMAFCSEECRCRQIFMDEEEETNALNCCTREYNCSLAATSSSSSSLSSHSSSRSGKSPKNRAIAY